MNLAKRIRYCLITFLFQLIFLLANAQSKLSFEQLTIEHGLANNSVRTMLQDQEGYLWFGTLNGLSRYDGKQFKTFDYDPGDSTSIGNNKIRGLFQDGAGYIWATTYDDHAHRFDPQTETFINFPSNLGEEYIDCTVSSVYESSPGVVWMYLGGKGCVRIISTAESPDYSSWFFSSNNGLTSDYLNEIWADRNNGLWVGTYEGISYLPDDRMSVDSSGKARQFLADPGRSVVAFCETETAVWAGTQTGELFKISQGQAELVWKTPALSNGTQRVRDLQASKDGRVIVATESGLLVVDSETGGQQYFNRDNSSLPTNLLASFYLDQHSDCWFVTDLRGVVRFQPDLQKFTHYPLQPEVRQSILEGEKQVFQEDQNGDLWVGIYGGGISRFDREQEVFEQFLNEENNPGSLSSNLILSIAHDRSGNIWAGTYKRGVNKVNLEQSNFHSLKNKTGAERDFSNEVRAVYEDSRKWIWTGNKRGEVIVYDQEFQPLFNLKDLLPALRIHSGVYAFEEDGNGNIWIGTKGDGIFVLKNIPSNHSVSAFNQVEIQRFSTSSPERSRLSHNDAFDLHEDRHGQMWVALYHGGVNIIRNPLRNGQEVLHYRHNENDKFALSDDRVRCFLEDRQGNMWVGTSNGLNFVAGQYVTADNLKFRQIERTNDPLGLSYNDVIGVSQDSDGTIWVGTYGGGINRLKSVPADQPFQFDYIRESDGLTSNLVLSIVEDHHGFLWVGTDFGLSKYDPKAQTFENFYAANGLGENSFSEGPGILTSSNKLVFGHISGMVWFETDSVQKSQRQVPLVLTNLLVNGKTDKEKLSEARHVLNDPSESIRLKYNENVITFEFAALDFKAPSKIQYAFQLEEYEQNWNRSGNLSSAIYRELQPGDYRFRMRASNSDGVWTNPEMTLNLSIAPPPWKTWWAYTAYFLLAFGLFWLARRIILERIRLKHEVQFEKQLADDKLKFYTSISHEFKTPLALILGPVEDLLGGRNLSPAVEKPLRMVRRNTHRLLELIDQLMDFRKIQKGFFKPTPVRGALVPFLDEIFQTFKPLAERKQIDFSFRSEAPDRPVMLDFRSLEKIVFNLLSNAFKHTASGQRIVLNLELAEAQNQLLISVSDKGEGIRKKDLPHIFERFNLGNRSRWKEESSTGIGLSLVRELVEMQGGVVSVESTLGKGSCFTVKLPLVFASEDEMDRSAVLPELNYTKKFVDVVDEDEPDAEPLGRKSEKEKETILVVEDNLDLQLYLRNNLSSNYHVLQAANGKIGLELAKNKDPDLIVCDIMMPEMDGIELTRMLKTEFHTSHIPIILLTAKSLEEHKIEGIETGADDYITKPFNMIYLEKRIKNMLKQRKQLRERFSRDLQTAPKALAHSAADQEFLDKVVQLVEENLSDPDFSIETLLQHFSYGRTVFYKKMKGISGYSPKDFLRIVRMKKAGSLLCDTNQTVSEVAFAIGFNDPNYFSKQFKKHFGENPSEYQKRVCQGNNPDGEGD
ncbi:hybrid sensor histidine kinase/response regulator transcription factor [Sunxiuqinia dokdonensis]|uniref:hybrid sensor histidine kinase/response regulator transcription factor n=1 Tax=Sunxiuqinia dokdonensis TaxID=1409788 RepID=UPI0009EC6DF9|nr:hybrid sensor histidine kinase/response regulator transcription factor [Sunxiuqinia dokdonensis]